MKNKNHLIIIAITFMSGCGLAPPIPKQMYRGSPLPLEKVGVISEGARLWQYVTKIDGEYVVNPTVGAARFTKGLHVLPGTHTVTAKYLNLEGVKSSSVLFAKSEQELVLEVKSGHTYVLRADITPEQIKFWFEDKGENYNQECLTPENYEKIVRLKQPVPSC